MIIDYESLVQKSLLSVVKDAFLIVSKNGFTNKHHFYITFSTNFPGVLMPEYLKETYNEEMTIIIKDDYYNLEVNNDSFSVNLTFQNASERLTIPFKSIISFVDPSVKFGLQFTPLVDEEVKNETNKVEESFEGSEKTKASNVVSFDKFKNKN